MVVTFIAILELVKSGILRVEQATRFSPIRLVKVSTGKRLAYWRAHEICRDAFNSPCRVGY